MHLTFHRVIETRTQETGLTAVLVLYDKGERLHRQMLQVLTVM